MEYIYKLQSIRGGEWRKTLDWGKFGNTVRSKFENMILSNMVILKAYKPHNSLLLIPYHKPYVPASHDFVLWSQVAASTKWRAMAKTERSIKTICKENTFEWALHIHGMGSKTKRRRISRAILNQSAGSSLRWYQLCQLKSLVLGDPLWKDFFWIQTQRGRLGAGWSVFFVQSDPFFSVQGDPFLLFFSYFISLFSPPSGLGCLVRDHYRDRVILFCFKFTASSKLAASLSEFSHTHIAQAPTGRW
jgi:hypothetical protein